MGNWKEILTRSLIILLAALLIVVGFQMLASDEIAAGAASTTTAEVLGDENADGGEEETGEDVSALTGTVMSFVKEIMFMGIPFAITLGVLALIRKIDTGRKARQIPDGEAA